MRSRGLALARRRPRVLISLSTAGRRLLLVSPSGGDSSGFMHAGPAMSTSRLLHCASPELIATALDRFAVDAGRGL